MKPSRIRIPGQSAPSQSPPEHSPRTPKPRRTSSMPSSRRHWIVSRASRRQMRSCFAVSPCCRKSRASASYTAFAAPRWPSIPCTKGLPGSSAWTSSTADTACPISYSPSSPIGNEYDYFFVHYEYTDSCGEDADFLPKVKHIEDLDRSIDRMIRLNPAVFAVTGDHSTPAGLKSHSWHPVPLLLASPTCRRDGSNRIYRSRLCQRCVRQHRIQVPHGTLAGSCLALDEIRRVAGGGQCCGASRPGRAPVTTGAARRLVARMISFSVSTTKKNTTPASRSRGQIQAGIDAVSKRE